MIDEVCRRAVDEDYLRRRRWRARHDGMADAVRSHDTAHLYGWLVEVFSYQGIADARASAYMDAHGRVTHADVARGLDRGAACPKLPSYWLSHSVLQWIEGAVTGAVFFAAVLLSNVLFFGSLAFNFTGSMFYGAASAVQSRSSVFRRWHWFQILQRKQQPDERRKL